MQCEPSLLAEVDGAGGIVPIDLWNRPLEAVLKANATSSIRGDSGGLKGKTDEGITQQFFLGHWIILDLDIQVPVQLKGPCAMHLIYFLFACLDGYHCNNDNGEHNK